MNLPQPETQAEKAAVRRAVKKLQDDWAFAASFGFEEVLNTWPRFVQSVEDGYLLNTDDYTQRLELRESMQELADCLPERFRQEVNAFLDSWDQRFRFATTQTKEPLMREGEAEVRFWWYRIPKKLLPPLLDELRRDGVV